MSYYVVTLSSEEIREGILFQIGDALSAAFDSSTKAILVGGKRGEKEDLLVFFDNSATNDNFHEEYGDAVQDVLFFNDAAKAVVSDAGIKLTVKETIDEPPRHAGTMNRTCHYINLH